MLSQYFWRIFWDYESQIESIALIWIVFLRVVLCLFFVLSSKQESHHREMAAFSGTGTDLCLVTDETWIPILIWNCVQFLFLCKYYSAIERSPSTLGSLCELGDFRGRLGDNSVIPGYESASPRTRIQKVNTFMTYWSLKIKADPFVEKSESTTWRRELYQNNESTILWCLVTLW